MYSEVRERERESKNRSRRFFGGGRGSYMPGEIITERAAAAKSNNLNISAAAAAVLRSAMGYIR